MTHGVHVWLRVTHGANRTPYRESARAIGPATVVIIAEDEAQLPTTVPEGITLPTHVRSLALDLLDPGTGRRPSSTRLPPASRAYTARADGALMLDAHGFIDDLQMSGALHQVFWSGRSPQPYGVRQGGSSQ